MKHSILPLLFIALILGCAGPSPRYSSGVSSGGRYSQEAQESRESRNSERSNDRDRGSRQELPDGVRRSEMSGEASWYGPGFQGNLTANGETFDMYDMTAAHKTLPFNTIVEVTDVETGESIRVRINDRGPYAHGRIIDLSKKAAQRLGMIERGHAQVELRIIE